MPMAPTWLRVDPATGEVSGETDADIAAFITNVEGDESDLSFKGLFIAPVEITY